MNNQKIGKITFRKFVKPEIGIVLETLKEAAFWLRGKKIDYWQNWIEPEEGHLAWIQEGFDREEFYIVENDGQPVGCFRLQWRDTMFWGEQPDDAGYIHSFSIDRSLAGKGIGRQVLDMISLFCIEQGKTHLRLDCGTQVDGLRRYYETCGFIAVRQVTVYGESLVLYEKKLVIC